MALINNLADSRTYLVGAMDRVKDGGRTWRASITPFLKDLKIQVINPCSHLIGKIEEGVNTREIIDEYKKTGQYQKIRDEYSKIRNADLRCVDISDFIICHLDIDVHMCGSYEEIVTANRQKKPILIWCEQGKQNAPNWLFFMLPHEHIFSSMNELIEYIELINTSNLSDINERWFFINRNKL